MLIQPGKIAVMGAVLSGISLLVGLLHTSLPSIFFGITDFGITFLVSFCYGIFAMVALALATVVFSITCLFMSPIGVLFLLSTLWVVLNTRRSSVTR